MAGPPIESPDAPAAPPPPSFSLSGAPVPPPPIIHKKELKGAVRAGGNLKGNFFSVFFVS